MDYKIHYVLLMLKAKNRTITDIDKYFEIHHILPKALGGSNNPENLVGLTAREHFIAHWLLAKMYGGSMWSALLLFKGKDNKYHNSRLYDAARKKVAKETSIRMIGNKASVETKAKMSKAHIGKKFSDEARKNMSKARKGETRKPMSEATKEKLKKANLGKTLSKEHKEKMSKSHKGKTFTDEHKAKLSAWQLGKPKRRKE